MGAQGRADAMRGRNQLRAVERRGRIAALVTSPRSRGAIPRTWLIFVAALGVFFATSSTACAVTPVNVYRFRNVVNGSYFWTADDAERLTVARTLSGTYSFEGIAWTLDYTSPLATYPLYRFYQYSNGCHFYTADPAEANSLMGNGAYHYDGIAYKVSMTAPNPGSLVYRFYYIPNGSHFYSADLAEVNRIIATLGSTYRYEGPVFYVPTAPAAYVTDDERFRADIMIEWVRYYWYLIDGLGNLDTAPDCASGVTAIANNSTANWQTPLVWSDYDVWERDWKSSTLPGGNDYRLADDVDLAVFCGHGEGQNFVMNNANYDHYAALSEMKLGDRDLEWLLAFTCNFLNGNPSDFGAAANGIHLINGYSTDMTITTSGGLIFASYAMPLGTRQAYGVRVAWYKYGQATQNAADVNTARTFGAKTAVNDYLWGYGPVAVDPPPYSPATAGQYAYWDTRLNW